MQQRKTCEITKYNHSTTGPQSWYCFGSKQVGTWWYLNMASAPDLVGDGTELHSYVPLTGHLLGERVVRQSVAMSNALGVEQEGVDDVLIHVVAFVICRHANMGSRKRSRLGL